VAQAFSRRLLTAEARARVSPFGVCGGQSGTGIGFSGCFSVLIPLKYHSILMYHLADEK
jgi:hypothetical protein